MYYEVKEKKYKKLKINLNNNYKKLQEQLQNIYNEQEENLNEILLKHNQLEELYFNLILKKEKMLFDIPTIPIDDDILRNENTNRLAVELENNQLNLLNKSKIFNDQNQLDLEIKEKEIQELQEDLDQKYQKIMDNILRLDIKQTEIIKFVSDKQQLYDDMEILIHLLKKDTLKKCNYLYKYIQFLNPDPQEDIEVVQNTIKKTEKRLIFEYNNLQEKQLSFEYLENYFKEDNPIIIEQLLTQRNKRIGKQNEAITILKEVKKQHIKKKRRLFKEARIKVKAIVKKEIKKDELDGKSRN